MQRLLLLPFAPRPGDPDGNAARIAAALRQAAGADLLVLPRAALTGAPLGDLGRQPDFLAGCEACLRRLAALTAGSRPGAPPTRRPAQRRIRPCRRHGWHPVRRRGRWPFAAFASAS